MKLIPKNWIWDNLEPDPSWLTGCPADYPLLWLARLNENPAVESRLLSWLSPAERSRLARFQQQGDQRRFLNARGLLRLLVGAHLNVPPSAIEFGEGPFGKPFVMAAAGTVHFNVAHSGLLVLLAFHPRHEVGVDVEEIRPDDDLASTARQVFTPEEYGGWLQLPPEEQLTAFYKKWTRHEAGLKAMGTGLAGAPDPTMVSRLTWFDLALPEGYQGAVASLPRAASNTR